MSQLALGRLQQGRLRAVTQVVRRPWRVDHVFIRII